MTTHLDFDLCDGPHDGPPVEDHYPYEVQNGQCACGSFFLRCGCPIDEAHSWCEDAEMAVTS